jgi:2-succinyl-5-enolpyruvyl-6-hydroxy-3-cyclohexene-1-carboxylate synthase
MSERDVTTAFATALVDEWARAGVTDAVVAPGSRNAPLVLALARDRRLRVQVVLDERSAAFRALGLGLATDRPAVVCCTSGSAAANFLPAVVEADHARVPVLVCTADRPPELRDSGAGQTIDQTHLFGRSVRWFADPGPPADEPGVGPTWRALASRAYASAVGPPAGPVHVNLPFREPLLPTGAPLVDAPGRADGAPWTRVITPEAAPGAEVVERVVAFVRAHPHGCLAAGWGSGAPAPVVTRFAQAAGWPLFADAISQVRTFGAAVTTYEAVLRAPAFADAHRPDAVLRIGAPPTSKVANAFLDGADAQVVVDPNAGWLDPTHRAGEIIAAAPALLLDEVAAALGAPVDTAWFDEWLAVERDARGAIDAVLDRAGVPFEGRIARDLATGVVGGGALVVASSLPVRALEWCMPARDELRVFANRGANGIDGFVSTALGIAASGLPTTAFCGDLCFLHDSNGLLGIAAAREQGREMRATFVVVDNNGGGIFSFLPPAELDEFERLFATPQGVDIVDVARAHGVAAERVDDLDALKGNLVGDGVRVIVVPVDRTRSVALHRELWDAVSAAVVARERFSRSRGV